MTKHRTLWDMKENEKAFIGPLSVSIKPEHALRLKELGFMAGEEVRCVQKTPFGGPKLFEVRDSVYGLALALAQSIFLQEK